MAKFLITTEVKHTVTYEYEVEAESQDEAEQKVCYGEMRGEGNISSEEEEWGIEMIISTNQI